MSHPDERSLCAQNEGRPGESLQASRSGQSVEAHDHSTVRDREISTPAPLTTDRHPIERFDVLTVSRRDGSRQLWAECIERHRADAYAENLRRILDDAALPAGDVEVVVELTTAVLVRPGLQFSDELLLHEPDMDEGSADA